MIAGPSLPGETGSKYLTVLSVHKRCSQWSMFKMRVPGQGKCRLNGDDWVFITPERDSASILVMKVQLQKLHKGRCKSVSYCLH